MYILIMLAILMIYPPAFLPACLILAALSMAARR